jgi:hypothetical protein
VCARLSSKSRLKLQGGEVNDKASTAVSFYCPSISIHSDSVLLVPIFAFQIVLFDLPSTVLEYLPNIAS